MGTTHTEAGSTMSLEAFKAKALADPAVQAAYDALAPEFELAEAFIEARAVAGLSQAALAKRAGITQAQVSRIEGGQWPQPATLTKLAGALGLRARLSLEPLG